MVCCVRSPLSVERRSYLRKMPEPLPATSDEPICLASSGYSACLLFACQISCRALGLRFA